MATVAGKWPSRSTGAELVGDDAAADDGYHKGERAKETQADDEDVKVGGRVVGTTGATAVRQCPVLLLIITIVTVVPNHRVGRH